MYLVIPCTHFLISCGSLIVTGLTNWTAPGNYSDIATDGTGAVVASGSGTFTGVSINYTENFSAQPTKNPIHWHIVGDGSVLFDGFADNPCLPPSGLTYQGPPIPAGFVLRTITCTTAVFNAPGGQPLASGEKITAGQTWFVSPKSVKDAKGNSWTEVFNSGVLDGYIWTSCVGGAPVK